MPHHVSLFIWTAVTIIIDWVLINNRNFFLTAAEVGKSKIKVLAVSESDENPLT